MQPKVKCMYSFFDEHVTAYAFTSCHAVQCSVMYVTKVFTFLSSKVTYQPSYCINCPFSDQFVSLDPSVL